MRSFKNVGVSISYEPWAINGIFFPTESICISNDLLNIRVVKYPFNPLIISDFLSDVILSYLSYNSLLRGCSPGIRELPLVPCTVKLLTPPGPPKCAAVGAAAAAVVAAVAAVAVANSALNLAISAVSAVDGVPALLALNLVSSALNLSASSAVAAAAAAAATSAAVGVEGVCVAGIPPSFATISSSTAVVTRAIRLFLSSPSLIAEPRNVLNAAIALVSASDFSASKVALVVLSLVFITCLAASTPSSMAIAFLVASFSAPDLNIVSAIFIISFFISALTASYVIFPVSL